MINIAWQKFSQELLVKSQYLSEYFPYVMGQVHEKLMMRQIQSPRYGFVHLSDSLSSW